MRLSRIPSIEIKTPSQFARMREAGLVVARMLKAVAAAAEPGISTAELDAIAEREMKAAGAQPSFMGYHGYPASICTSVNDQIVHGIPDPDVRLRRGDVLSIDAGAIVGGWHGDAAITIGDGRDRRASDRAAAGLRATPCGTAWRPRWPDRRLTDISHAIESSALASGGYGVVREYTGHFIGSAMHMDPPVPNYGRPGRGPVLTEGMAMAIEPMLVLGDRHTRLLDDGWTVVTADGSLAAHFEHTVAITADGPWVLTAEDGGESGLASDRCRRGRARDQRRPGWCEEGLMATDPNLIRASDQDRDRVANVLREHHAVGRLDAEEFNDRLDKTFAAKTMGDLEALTADLPAVDLYPLPTSSMSHHHTRRGGLPSTVVGAMSRGHGRLLARLAGGMGLLARDCAAADRDLGAVWRRISVAAVGHRALGRDHGRAVADRLPSRRSRPPRPDRSWPGRARAAWHRPDGPRPDGPWPDGSRAAGPAAAGKRRRRRAARQELRPGRQVWPRGNLRPGSHCGPRSSRLCSGPWGCMSALAANQVRMPAGRSFRHSRVSVRWNAKPPVIVSTCAVVRSAATPAQQRRP